MCLAVAMPTSLRLSKFSGATQLLHERVVRAQIQGACLSIAVKDICSRKSAIVVVCGDAIPNCEQSDKSQYPTTDSHKGLHSRFILVRNLSRVRFLRVSVTLSQGISFDIQHPTLSG